MRVAVRLLVQERVWGAMGESIYVCLRWRKAHWLSVRCCVYMRFRVQNAHPRIEQLNGDLQIQASALAKRQVLRLYVFSRAQRTSLY